MVKWLAPVGEAGKWPLCKHNLLSLVLFGTLPAPKQHAVLKQSAAKRKPQEGICNGVQDSGCPGNIRKMYVGCPHPHRPEPGGMGHMEQGHSELFWVATALQLTPGSHLTYL